MVWLNWMFSGYCRVVDKKERDGENLRNHHEKWYLERILYTCQLTIADMAGTIPDVIDKKTIILYSSRNQPACSPGIPNPLICCHMIPIFIPHLWFSHVQLYIINVHCSRWKPPWVPERMLYVNLEASTSREYVILEEHYVCSRYYAKCKQASCASLVSRKENWLVAFPGLRTSWNLSTQCMRDLWHQLKIRAW